MVTGLTAIALTAGSGKSERHQLRQSETPWWRWGRGEAHARLEERRRGDGGRDRGPGAGGGTGKDKGLLLAASLRIADE